MENRNKTHSPEGWTKNIRYHKHDLIDIGLMQKLFLKSSKDQVFFWEGRFFPTHPSTDEDEASEDGTCVVSSETGILESKLFPPVSWVDGTCGCLEGMAGATLKTGFLTYQM